MRFPVHIPHMPQVSVLKSGPLALHRSSRLALLGLAAVFAVAPATGQTSAPPTPAPPAAVPAAAPAPQHPASSGEITEEELRQLLVGKQLFLRGGYLGESLSFNEHGDPTGHPTTGSYTLSGVEIEKVHITRHKVELIGDRYALHFLGALPYEDPTAAVDRVKITPKKKVLRITIDREQVVKEKKAKEPAAKGKGAKPATPAPAYGQPVASSETDVATTPSAAQQPATPEPAQEPAAPGDKTDQAADAASVTTTTSPAHAAQVLRDALGKVLAQGLDDKVRAQMPEFWQLYYQAQTEGVAFRAKDPTVLNSGQVETHAKVLSSIAPDSNEFAQASGIAGRALYRAVIGPDGKPGDIAIVRPIGFGLDENAVSAIRKATFAPAVKDGKPVAESLDLAVLFRIYSKRTSVAATENTENKSTGAAKPGPYTVRAQQEQPPAQPQQ
jgi:TonB family protein